MKPTRSGSTPNSSARARTTRTAASPSAPAAAAARAMSSSTDASPAIILSFNSAIGSSPPGTRRYFNTNVVTPSAASRSATPKPSLSIDSAWNAPPGATTTAVPSGSPVGRTGTSVGTTTLVTTSVAQSSLKYRRPTPVSPATSSPDCSPRGRSLSCSRIGPSTISATAWPTPPASNERGRRTLTTVGGVRYLVSSDLHYGLAQFDWIAEQASDFDAVILAGDHLDVAGHADVGAQVALLSAYLDSLSEHTRTIANSGNHDLTQRRDHGEKAAVWLDDLDERVVTDGRSVQVGTDLVSVCAWWEGPVTRDELEQ